MSRITLWHIPHYLPAYARGVTLAIIEMSGVLLGADPIGQPDLNL
jgi:hypothetical protein